MAGGLRAGRGTNLAILMLLAGALGTGALATAIGSGWSQWPVVAHGVIGLALAVVAPWKWVISRRGVHHRGARSAPSLVLALLILLTLGMGIAHAAGVGDLGFVPARALWVHVAAALATVPLAIWHVVARRTYPRRTDLSRRSLLRGGAVLAGGAAAYVAYEGTIGFLGLAGERRRHTGSHEAGSFDPSAMPTTIWLNDSRPELDPESHRVLVSTSAGERPWSVSELAAFGDDVRATLDCTSGWYSTQDWAGVRLDRVIGDSSGRSVLVRSITGYSRRFPLEDLAGIWLATHVGAAAVDLGHGGPVRVVAPGRRGFWWVKWVDSVRVDDRPWWWQPPFPLT